VWTTNVPGVLITQEALELAFRVGRAVEKLLAEAACERAKPRGARAEKRLVNTADIESAALSVTVDLVALIAAVRDEHAAHEEIRRVA
jgi:hypothetical protein